MSMEAEGVLRDSAEYAELVAEFFVETVRKAATSALTCEYGGEEITPALMEALQHVYLHGASPVREVAAGLSVSLSAASQLVDRLAKKGLVTRSEDVADRRITVIDLTQPGRELVKSMRERRSAWFDSITRNMPEDKRRAFLEGLESFLQVSLANEENVEKACVKCGIKHAPFCVIRQIKDAQAGS